MKTNHAEPPKPPRRKNRGQWKLPPCCLSCEKQGTLEERCVPTVQEIRGEEVNYETLQWVCRECGAAFMSPQQATEGVKTAVEAYQKKHGLLTAKKIRENRAALGLSADELAKAAGIGEATVKRLEAGATVQQKSTDTLLRSFFGKWRMQVKPAQKDLENPKLKNLMKIKIQTLGPIRQAEFELGDLTIICGANNTGKTYATYALYGFLEFWRSAYTIPVPKEYYSKLMDQGQIHIPLTDHIAKRNDYLQNASKRFSRSLPRIMAANEKNFKGTSVLFHLDEPSELPSRSFNRQFVISKKQIFSISKKQNSPTLDVSLLVQAGEIAVSSSAIKRAIGDSLQEILFGHLFPRPFISSAERTGAAIFRKELDFARNRLVDEIGSMKRDLDPFKLLDRVYTDYALPVKRNVDFTRKLEETAKEESFIARHHPELLEKFEGIIGGDYKVTNEDELYYIPASSRSVRLTVGESSSSVRSLLDLGFYLRHVAQKGDILIIDEPELNLHPQNQRLIARLFASLINIGLKVYLTTHSDYIIKELNTLIMMKRPDPEIRRIREKEGYVEGELLDSDRVRVYIAERRSILLDGDKKKTKCNTLTPADIDPQLGIEARSFDETIDDMNRIQELLYFSKEI